MIKRVGEPISLREATEALHVIKKTSGGNPLREELRRKRLFKNNPIDVNMSWHTRKDQNAAASMEVRNANG